MFPCEMSVDMVVANNVQHGSRELETYVHLVQRFG